MLSEANKPILLIVFMMNVVMLSVIMLSVVMLSVVMLNVIMLNVVAPRKRPRQEDFRVWSNF
jgi:hypothetical protein